MRAAAHHHPCRICRRLQRPFSQRNANAHLVCMPLAHWSIPVVQLGPTCGTACSISCGRCLAIAMLAERSTCSLRQAPTWPPALQNYLAAALARLQHSTCAAQTLPQALQRHHTTVLSSTHPSISGALARPCVCYTRCISNRPRVSTGSQSPHAPMQTLNARIATSLLPKALQTRKHDHRVSTGVGHRHGSMAAGLTGRGIALPETRAPLRPSVP